MGNKKKTHSELETIRKKSPEQLRQAALEDPDAQPVPREMFARAVPWGSIKPNIIKKKDVHMFLDEDVIAFFKEETGGKRGYQTMINNVLRQYMEHRKQT
ncbi:MAG: BrnA antitoxin family protein [Desulfovibrio sp.]|nr:BrnA antitoxin family protein [Desulfovibrio sp.]MBI4961313.1 BrnA antitoxin family protein [Desulfovibrio sp.]